MAKPSWISTNPSTGSGDGIVNATPTQHTGRLQRTGDLTFKASGAADVIRNCTQSAKPEFVTISDISAPKAGGNVTITGKSNSSKLTFALGAGDITLSLPSTYSAGGATTNNAAAIAGDPGASAEFDFSITLNVPANATTSAKSKAITVTAAGGQTATSNINQAAGDPTLSVSPASITFDWQGTAVAVTVTSNTNWSVE